MLNFVGARIAAIDLSQADLAKPWNHVWRCYGKAPTLLLSPFWKSRGSLQS